jgi:hypothetical protein
MHDYESRPSYSLVGLMAAGELRELLDEVYLYALEPAKQSALAGPLNPSSFYAHTASEFPRRPLLASS